jgi:hypothetical protein
VLADKIASENEGATVSVMFYYVDESHDDSKFCLSAIGIKHRYWKECFDLVRAHRSEMKQRYGLLMRAEIHARELLKGSGRISGREIGKWERSRIFFECLRLVAKLPEVSVINVCLEKAGRKDAHLTAWDRLMNRIERTMKAREDNELTRRRLLIRNIESKADAVDVAEISLRLLVFRSRAVIVADQGREREITQAIRKMHVHNLIPSRYGAWGDGSRTANITTDRVIEDPIFKESSRSYFVQLADCVAYALLKREVAPTPRIEKYGVHKMFDQTLSNVCFLPASNRDPLGIVRN